jgi:hypothetical protein
MGRCERWRPCTRGEDVGRGAERQGEERRAEERIGEGRRSVGLHVYWDGQALEHATASNVGTRVLTLALANAGKSPRPELILVTPCFHVLPPPQQTAITMRGRYLTLMSICPASASIRPHPLCTAGIHVSAGPMVAVLLAWSRPSRPFTCCFSAVRCSPPCSLFTPCPAHPMSCPPRAAHCPHCPLRPRGTRMQTRLQTEPLLEIETLPTVTRSRARVG